MNKSNIWKFEKDFAVFGEGGDLNDRFRVGEILIQIEFVFSMISNLSYIRTPNQDDSRHCSRVDRECPPPINNEAYLGIRCLVSTQSKLLSDQAACF